MHIGSQITELEPFEQAFRLMADLTRTLRAEGHDIRHLDLGGGLGVPYRGTNDVPPHPDEYAAMVKRTLGDLGCQSGARTGAHDHRQCRNSGFARDLREIRRRTRFHHPGCGDERSHPADAL